MSESVPPFTIAAIRGRTPQTATRGNAASAMCLADRWDELGCQSIHITDGAGIARDREQFRATLPLVKRLGRRPFNGPGRRHLTTAG